MPLIFSTTAKMNPENPGGATESVAIFGYGGILIGPVLIGILADLFTLRIAFSLLSVLAMFIISSAVVSRKNVIMATEQ